MPYRQGDLGNPELSRASGRNGQPGTAEPQVGEERLDTNSGYRQRLGSNSRPLDANDQRLDADRLGAGMPRSQPSSSPDALRLDANGRRLEANSHDEHLPASRQASASPLPEVLSEPFEQNLTATARDSHDSNHHDTQQPGVTSPTVDEQQADVPVDRRDAGDLELVRPTGIEGAPGQAERVASTRSSDPAKGDGHRDGPSRRPKNRDRTTRRTGLRPHPKPKVLQD